MPNIKSYLVISAVAISAYGCALVPPSQSGCVTDVNEIGYTLAQQLAKNLGESDLEKTVIVGSIANLDDVSEVSPIGRLVGEHLSSRLAQLGLRVIEPRMRNSLVVDKGGEHILSREVRDLAVKANAYAFVSGTVTKMQGRYFFNARMIRASDAKILGSFDICLTGKVKEAGL